MKILNFFAAFAAVIAAIGSTSYLFYIGEPVCGMCNIVLAVMAWPTFVDFVNDLKGNDGGDTEGFN